MKKVILAVTLLLSTITASAQFYTSFAAGATIGANEKVLGQNISLLDGSSSNLSGSYGEGYHGQLRVGYFFNETFGLELGAGYLHGSNQDVNQIDGVLDMEARGRAYGASLSAVFNVTKNVYVRFGGLIKVGGKTEAITALTLPNALTGLGTDIEADFTTDFKGKLPFGFVGAIGYKFNVSEKINLFAEVEYMNITVTRDRSNLADYSGTVDANTLQVILSSNPLLEELSPLLSDDQDWSTSGKVAPYSSIGINFGVTYNF